MSETIGRYNVILELITESKKTKDGINALENKLASIEKKLGGLGKLFKTATEGFAIMYIVQVLQGVNNKIFEITKKYQQYATILKVATGSQQAAAQTMKLIEDTARETTFSVDELTSSYIMMINRGFKPTKQEIIAIADLAASQGRSFGDLTQAMLNATTGEYEMLKGFGIKVSSVGDKLNLSFKGMNQTIEKTPEAMQKAILALGQMKGVAGSNAEQMNTLNGILSNMGDNAEKIWKNIGERLKKFYTESLTGVANLVDWLSKLTEIDLADKYREEQAAVGGLVSRITDLTVKTDERSRLISELNEKYPFFLKNMDIEKVSNEELIARMSQVNKLYDTRVRLQLQEDKINDLRKQKATLENEKTKEETILEEKIQKAAAKYNIDITKEQTLIDRKNKVQKELYKINTDESRTTLENWDALFKRWSIYTTNIRLFNVKRRLGESQINKELELQLKILDNIQKETGGNSLEDINKMFDYSKQGDNPKPDPTPTVKPKTREQILKEQERKEKERQQKMLDELEKYYIEKEIIAKKEIKNEEELSVTLQSIQYNKNLAILRLKKSFVDVNSKEFSELSLQIYDTEKAYVSFIEGINRTQIKPLDTTFEADAKAMAKLREELEVFELALGKLDKLGPSLEQYKKLITVGFDISKKDADENAKKQLDDIAEMIKKNIIEPMVKAYKDGEGKKKGLLASLLGVDNETAKLLGDNIMNMRDAVLDLYDLEISKIDELIKKQEERYDKAKALAEKGKVDQLNIEEARLRALQEKRDKYEKQQRAIAAMQIVTAQSVAAAEALQGLVGSFKKGGVAGIVEGSAYLLAIGAAILSIRNSISSAFSDIPGYAEGINAYGISDNGLVTGKGSGKSDSNLAKLSKGERVVPEEVNAKIGYNFPNARLPEAVHMYRIMPAVLANIKKQSQTNNDIALLRNDINEVRKSIESLKIVTKLDKDGFSQHIQSRHDEAIRRKKIIG